MRKLRKGIAGIRAIRVLILVSQKYYSVIILLVPFQTCNIWFYLYVTLCFTFMLLCVLLRVPLCLKDFYITTKGHKGLHQGSQSCLLYTSDAADEEDSVDLGGR